MRLGMLIRQANGSAEISILKMRIGPSESDHQNRGPAYLLLARMPARFLQSALGLDYPSAWHLINFISFQIGVYFFFVFSRRWMKKWAAFACHFILCNTAASMGTCFYQPERPAVSGRVPDQP